MASRSALRAKAGSAVQYAVKTGRLARLNTQVCASCGVVAQAYHHWHGYGRAHLLDVIPLCDRCHKRLHTGIYNYEMHIPSWRNATERPFECCDEVPLSYMAQKRRIATTVLIEAAQHGAFPARPIGPLWVVPIHAVNRWLATSGTRRGPDPGSGKARLSQPRPPAAHGGSNDHD